MKKTVVFLMLLTIFSKVLGFARDISLSYFYGASVISDAYLISLTIPTVILAIIGKGISTGFVPMYTRVESQDGIDRANHYTNNLVNVVLILCTVILLIGVLFTEPVVKLFASGFDGATLEMAVGFTRITLIGVYFTGLVYVFSAFLQIKGAFLITALVGLPANLILIGSFLLSSKTNIYILAIGSVVAAASQFLLLIIFGYKNKYRYKFRLDMKDENIRKMLVLAFPIILGSSVAQMNVLVDRTLASQIVEGGISALNYANNINLIALGIIVASISSVLFPRISKMAVENNIKEMKKYLSETITTINILVLPITVGYMIFAEPIVQLLFGRGEFSSQAVSLTSSALFFYSIGLVAKSQRDILSNVFYSLQDTKTPMLNASIALIINIVLNIVLSKYLGISGLALASSISLIFCSFLLFVSLRKRIGDFGNNNLFLSFIKVLLASLVMGGLSKFVFDFLMDKFTLTFSLIVAILLGIIIYFCIISFMRIKEVNMIVLEIKKKAKKHVKVKEEAS